MYAEIGKRQASRARDWVRKYRPWQEAGPGWHYSRASRSIDQILEVQACTSRGILEELNNWNPRVPGSKLHLTWLREDTAKTKKLLQLTEKDADPFPELKTSIESSLELAREVEARLDTLIKESIP